MVTPVSFNADVELEHHAGASRTYLGAHRSGITDDRPEAASLRELVSKALSARFFLVQRIPLPRSTLEDFNYLPKCFPMGISLFWAAHLEGLEKLVGQASPVELEWRKLIPEAIRPAAGRINLAAFDSLMLNANLHGSAWIRQFIFFFP